MEPCRKLLNGQPTELRQVMMRLDQRDQAVWNSQ